VSAAASIEVLESAAADDEIDRHVVAPAVGLADMPAVTVPGDVERGVRHGTPFPAAVLGEGEGYRRVLDGAGGLLAVYRVVGESARAEVVLA